jgi:hypothetical protein
LSNHLDHVRRRPKDSSVEYGALLLKEYDALRAEINSSIQNRNTILTFGFAATGGMFAAASLGDEISGGRRSVILIGLLIVGVPAISVFVFSLWVGEFARMARAGEHVAELEGKLNRLVAETEPQREPPLTWEQERWRQLLTRQDLGFLSHFIREDRVDHLSRLANRYPLIGSRLFKDSYLPVQLWFAFIVIACPLWGIHITGLGLSRFWWACIPFAVIMLFAVWRLFRQYDRVYNKAKDVSAASAP